MKKEIWKDIDEKFEGRYQVSNLGRLKFTKTNCIRKATIDTRGYVSQIVFIKSKATPVRIHRAVAIAFIPNPDKKPVVNHINGIRHDNRVENLEWCTHVENMNRSVFCKKGEKSHLSKLTEKEVVKILKLNDTVRNISERFNVSTKTITRIKRGDIWNHVFCKVSDKVRCKLSWKINLKIANEIRADYNKGQSCKELVEKYCLSQTQVTLILNNKRWKM